MVPDSSNWMMLLAGYQKKPKYVTVLSIVLYNAYTVECRNLNTFGFWTDHFCSVVIMVRTENSNAEIQTICSVFRHKFLSEIGTHDRSNIQFSDRPLS